MTTSQSSMAPYLWHIRCIDAFMSMCVREAHVEIRWVHRGAHEHICKWCLGGEVLKPVVINKILRSNRRYRKIRHHVKFRRTSSHAEHTTNGYGHIIIFLQRRKEKGEIARCLFLLPPICFFVRERKCTEQQ
eukprot:GEMP01059603.1.p1 GENE.GEMP01059603.1~~GEMP01059603.1.p1  ORF type:complete len:132 (-),score=12.53 GEMP01059603.1:246-641(-)